MLFLGAQIYEFFLITYAFYGKNNIINCFLFVNDFKEYSKH